MLIEQLDELRKVRQRSRQAIDLVDNDDVDLAGPDSRRIRSLSDGREIDNFSVKSTGERVVPEVAPSD